MPEENEVLKDVPMVEDKRSDHSTVQVTEVVYSVPKVLVDQIYLALQDAHHRLDGIGVSHIEYCIKGLVSEFKDSLPIINQ